MKASKEAITTGVSQVQWERSFYKMMMILAACTFTLWPLELPQLSIFTNRKKSSIITCKCDDFELFLKGFSASAAFVHISCTMFPSKILCSSKRSHFAALLIDSNTCEFQFFYNFPSASVQGIWIIMVIFRSFYKRRSAHNLGTAYCFLFGWTGPLGWAIVKTCGKLIHLIECHSNLLINDTI